MLHPDSIYFLTELKENNHKAWFDEHRPRYQTARKDFIRLIDQLLQQITGFDADIPVLEAKSCMFRINRDIRFSKDKSPYKTNFAASITKGGKSSPYAGYYLHVDATSCWVGGGIYHPGSPELKKIRQHIDLHGEKLLEIVEESGFNTTFGPLQGDRLKTSPKGFDKEHPHLALLQLKDFYVMQKLSTEAIFEENFVTDTADKYELLMPLIQFLNEAIDA